MTTQDIEEIAVESFKHAISEENEYINKYIDIADKVPIWDGSIYLYNDRNKSVESFIGIIKPQIKGKEVKKIKKGNIKYSLETKYIRAFQKDINGTLLIVCHEIDCNNTQLYYCNLLPVDIKSILDNLKDKNQKSVSLDMKPIKKGTASSMTNICFNFIRESRKQANSKIMKLEDVKNIKKVEFSILAKSKEEAIDSFLNQDIYWYAIAGENNQVIPIEKEKECKAFIKTTAKHEIKIGEKIYYNEITNIKDNEKEIVVLGKGINIIQFENEKKLKYNCVGNIFEQINDVEFICDFFEKKDLIIDGKKYTHNFTQKELDFFKERLKFLNKIKSVFEKFNVKFEDELDKLDKVSIKNLRIFIDICTNSNSEYKKDFEIGRVYSITIGSYNIAFWVVKNKKGKKDIINFYNKINKEYIFFIELPNKTRVEVSRFLILSKENLLENSNLNIDVIKESFKGTINATTSDQVILFVLKVISAYDKDNTSIDLLELAECINNKILECDYSDLSYINKAQIIKRKRQLEKQEIEKLIEIEKSNDTDIRIKCAIDILLERKIDFQMDIEKLDLNQKKEFLDYPIYNLYKK